ncbi:hypothetical protein JCM19232_2743 [Vibrio ishigakensis]|uniref:phosphodiesterase I n=1 Tax=Vibrio ishigakensis TaxID=1481914 RepID=A0A0B8PFQ4_9VIBR|nr:hypothetical protein JCM19232_2743 [Vibrio ishigakensis]
MNPVILPEGYYHDNFLKLVEHAQTYYPDLLSESETHWIQTFLSLDTQTQRLLVRLYTRKGEWFRSDKLNYAEIPDLKACAVSLSKQGFVSLPASLPATVLAKDLLTKPELCSLFPELSKSLKKDALINACAEMEQEVPVARLGFMVINQHYPDILPTLSALFFANARQDLSQFVLSDMGLQVFESYELSQERRFFNDRKEVNQLLSLSNIWDDYYAIEKRLPKQEKLLLITALIARLPDEVTHSYVKRRLERLINTLARDLERIEEYDSALTLFKDSSLPPSRERRVRILDKQEQLDPAKSLLDEMLLSPHNREELEIAQRIQKKLWRKLGLTAPNKSKPTIEEQRLELDLSSTRVEIAVAEHLNEQGFEVYFLENSFLCGLFGLAFWEVLFAPIEGAFLNRYQLAPKDLYSSDFQDKREHLIEDVFNSLKTNGYSGLKQTFKHKQGLANPFVHWKIFDESILDQADQCFPIETLVELIKVMLSDLRLFRTGMPDLIAFKDGQYLWVEVKGPGDKLQDNQIRWMTEFERLKVNFCVAYVNQ